MAPRLVPCLVALSEPFLRLPAFCIAATATAYGLSTWPLALILETARSRIFGIKASQVLPPVRRTDRGGDALVPDIGRHDWRHRRSCQRPRRGAHRRHRHGVWRRRVRIDRWLASIE